MDKVINNSRIHLIDPIKWKVSIAMSGVTQVSVAELIGLNKGSFSARIKTQSRFTDDEIKIISDYLKIDPSSFLVSQNTTRVLNFEGEPSDIRYFNDLASIYKIKFEDCQEKVRLLEQIINQYKRDQQRSDEEIEMLKENAVKGNIAASG